MSFEKQQAVVTYDPKATPVPAIIKVVESTPHMMGASMTFGAKVHKGA